MLGGVVEEGEQGVELVADLDDRLGPGGEARGEGLHRLERNGPVLRGVDRGQRLLGGGLLARGQGVEHVGRLVHPASLLCGGGEHVAQGGPEAERAVTGRQQRRGQAPRLEVAQQLRPGFAALAVAVSQGHQLLAAVGAHADDDQAAQPVLLESDAEVQPVNPPVHVVARGQIPLAPLRVLSLPALGQAADGRRGEAGIGAEERRQRRREVAARQAA